MSSSLSTFTGAVQTNDPSDWRHLIPRPSKDDHKYSRGYSCILGGEHLTGAASLAARAAQRVGCGLVRIVCPRGAADVYRTLMPSVITDGFRDTRQYKDMIAEPRINALLAGPGLGDGPASVERALAAARLGKPVVLDADALNFMAQTRESVLELFLEQFSPQQRQHILLTPHAGEFARFFPEFADQPPAQAAWNAAQLSGVCVLLKGADTFIAHTDQPVCANRNAPADLATAGSGDVLSGLCLGLLAQGLSAYDSGRIATAIHSRAASLHGAGLIAEDLNNLIPLVLKNLLP